MTRVAAFSTKRAATLARDKSVLIASCTCTGRRRPNAATFSISIRRRPTCSPTWRAPGRSSPFWSRWL